MGMEDKVNGEHEAAYNAGRKVPSGQNYLDTVLDKSTAFLS